MTLSLRHDVICIIYATSETEETETRDDIILQVCKSMLPMKKIHVRDLKLIRKKCKKRSGIESFELTLTKTYVIAYRVTKDLTDDQFGC